MRVTSPSTAAPSGAGAEYASRSVSVGTSDDNPIRCARSATSRIDARATASRSRMFSRAIVSNASSARSRSETRRGARRRIAAVRNRQIEGRALYSRASIVTAHRLSSSGPRCAPPSTSARATTDGSAIAAFERTSILASATGRPSRRARIRRVTDRPFARPIRARESSKAGAASSLARSRFRASRRARAKASTAAAIGEKARIDRQGIAMRFFTTTGAELASLRPGSLDAKRATTLGIATQSGACLGNGIGTSRRRTTRPHPADVHRLRSRSSRARAHRSHRATVHGPRLSPCHRRAARA